MKSLRWMTLITLAVLLLTACGQLTPPEPTTTPTHRPPTSTPIPPTVTATATATITPTPAYAPEGLGPTGFAPEVNPLTGLEPANPKLLDRRPLAIKVENLPRADRPQWGLSKADINYEYYTEEGSTRFISVFYGQDSEMVGPIRSARLFDINVVQMYKATFIFGSAWSLVYNRLLNQDFYNRLVIESWYSKPAVFRHDPSGKNFLMCNTSLMGQVNKNYGISDTRQNLDGMFFKLDQPAGGQAADSVYVRYSGAIYNRWDYDATIGKYKRFSDTDNASEYALEKYAALVDRTNNQQISADNVVVILVQHDVIIQQGATEVVEVPLLGTGSAYIARGGKIYPVTWSRPNRESVLTLQFSDGTPFPFEPGNTWFEIMGRNTQISQPGTNAWRFLHFMP